MKIKYYKEDDILVLRFGREPYDHAEMEGNVIVHFTKKKKPVRIEILEASKYLKKEAKTLSEKSWKKYFVSA